MSDPGVFVHLFDTEIHMQFTKPCKTRPLERVSQFDCERRLKFDINYTYMLNHACIPRLR